MGRLLKRVPLDFDYPINKIWNGFSNPYNSTECNDCGGTGHNKETKQLDDAWYGWHTEPKWIWVVAGKRRYNDNAWSNHINDEEVEALMKSGRLSNLTMPYWYHLNEENNCWEKREWTKDGWTEWTKCDKPQFPTAQSVNDWNSKGLGFGHDAINKLICVETRAKRMGVYGKCDKCKGEGQIWASEEIERLSDEWEESEPPIGEGYQLWENTTEGSPQSPVFDTLEKLCEWCELNATLFADIKTTKDEWYNMLKDDNVHAKSGNTIFI